jgi:hypothetical protein
MSGFDFGLPDLSSLLRREMDLEAAARKRSAQAKIVGPSGPPNLADAMADFTRVVREASRKAADYAAGVEIRESWMVPRDTIMVFSDTGIPGATSGHFAHPLTVMRLRNNGRVPLHSAYTSGNRELERERRLRARS